VEEKIVKVKTVTKFPELNKDTGFIQHQYFYEYIQKEHFRDGTFMIITKTGKEIKIFNIDNPRNNQIQYDDKEKHLKKQKKTQDIKKVPKINRSNSENLEIEKQEKEKSSKLMKK